MRGWFRRAAHAIFLTCNFYLNRKFYSNVKEKSLDHVVSSQYNTHNMAWLVRTEIILQYTLKFIRLKSLIASGKKWLPMHRSADKDYNVYKEIYRSTLSIRRKRITITFFKENVINIHFTLNWPVRYLDIDLQKYGWLVSNFTFCPNTKKLVIEIKLTT